MRRALPLLLLALAWIVPDRLASSEEPVPLDLQTAYRLALKRSETIAIQAEAIKQTEGRFLQALSTALPRATFELSEKRQSGSGSSASTLKKIPERKFIFSQPLFSGFKEFAAIAGSRAEHRQRVAERAHAQLLLLIDVADAFYLLHERQEDRKALEDIQTALTQRLDEVSEREHLGRSRRSEVVSAEAQLRRVEAEMELVHSQETTARQLLEFLTGRSPIDRIEEDGPPLPVLETEEASVAKASARPDVRAAEEAWRVAKNELRIAQAKFWPTVDLESNVYTKRVGVASDVDWDALLTVDVPLFQGGEAVGATRESASLARQAKLEWEETLRQAALDIRDAYVEFNAAMSRTQALAKAFAAAEESLSLQEADYRMSLVNNLDVLEALQALQDAKRDYIHAAHEAKRLYWQLRAATGAPLKP
ncbi:MAG: TolC family protein [Candidatus Omnitrophota bacterium]|nr:TolC family protein [Candidatus Omnitrophota bacterium]